MPWHSTTDQQQVAIHLQIRAWKDDVEGDANDVLAGADAGDGAGVSPCARSPPLPEERPLLRNVGVRSISLYFTLYDNHK